MFKTILFVLVSILSIDCFAQNTVEQLYQSKKYSEAYDAGMKLLKKSPKDLQLLKATAKSATELYMDKEATLLYEKAIKLSPNDSENYYLYGLHLNKFARRNEEVTQYKKALELKSDFKEVYSPYAYSLFKTGQFAFSDSISSLALEFDALDSRARLSKASTSAILGNVKDARYYFKLLLSVEPNNREALLNFGVFEENLKNYTEAMKRFEKILEFEPNDLDAKIRIGAVYFKLGLITESKSYLYKLLKDFPNEIKLLRTIAEIEMSSGNINIAKSLFFEIMNLDYKNPQSYLKMYELYSQFGNADSSVLVLNNGLKYNPTSVDLLMELGKVYGNSGKYKEAISIYQKVEKLEPNSIKILFHLSLAYQKNGFTEEALTYVNKAITLTKSMDTISYLYRMKAEIMLAKGDKQEATKIFKSILEINPSDIMAWYNLGIIYINNNDQEKAKIHLERALEINPNFAECRKIYIRFLAGQKKYDEALKQCELLRDSDPFGADDYSNAIKELMTQ